MMLPVVVRPVLDKEQIEPIDKGSCKKRFVFVHRPKVAVLPLSGFLAIRSQRAINGIRGLLKEPLAREPIDFLTQSLLEKCHESRDLSSSRRKHAFHDSCFRCTAFRRSVSRTGEQHSKCSHSLQ